MFFIAGISAKNVDSRAVWRGLGWCLGLLGKEGRMRKRRAVRVRRTAHALSVC